jgi:hypothetical protein
MTAEARLAAALDAFDQVQRDGASLLATTPAVLLDPELLAEAAAINATAAERLGDLLRRRTDARDSRDSR